MEQALVSCAAILAIRNEAAYLPALLPGLLDQGIDVVILDNDSSDDSRAIARSFASEESLRIEHLPWTGEYDLETVIRTKQQICNSLSHQWIINIDADEWLQSPVSGERLREGITRIDRLGYNAINFDELVFLPLGKTTETNYDFRRENLNYYFFESFPQRLMRAYRRDANLSNLDSGGHKLEGDALKLAPEHFILRHYIALSQQHIIDKYIGRPFSKSGIDRGWHRNRVGLSAEQLAFPEPQDLQQLSRHDDKEFDRSNARKRHYWEWQENKYARGRWHLGEIARSLFKRREK